MTQVLQLFKRTLTSTRFDATFAQFCLWTCSLIVLVAGILKLSRLQLNEAELFFGLLLVMTLSLLLAVAGLVLPVAVFVVQKQKTELQTPTTP